MMEGTLAFLPGWGFKASVWQRMTDQLSHYQTHLCDLPTPASDDDFESITHRLNEQLSPHTTLIAWSLSGLFAISLCANYPEKYKRLVLVSSAPAFICYDTDYGMYPSHAHSFRQLASVNLPEAMTQFQRLVCFPSKNTSLLKELQKHALTDSATLQFYLHLLFETNVSQTFKQLTQPTLQITGSLDAVLPAHASSLAIPQAGHACFLTHQDIFIQHLMDFISE
jgi:pimeloyl-[acyl-carrier protein] methyl ester esterase